jgi:trans-2,3-dihydro-3-hydroxyanthranilate isomerase
VEAIEQLRAFDPFAWREAEPGAGTHRYVLLDVFTAQPLFGNPLAVFVDARELDGERMQRLARELNLSETAFVLPAEGHGDVRVRIFTPLRELPFAGHPVLGSAVTVAAALARDRVTLETGAGEVPVAVGAGDGGERGSDPTGSADGARARFAAMEQPVPSWGEFEHERALLDALGVERSQLPVQACVNGPRHVFVGLRDERELAGLRPDVSALSALGELAVSCFVAHGDRVRSRMFAPALGVVEDPATGSAAGPLAVHLARHGAIAFGTRIEIAQGIEIGRRSQLLATAYGTAERVERVEVSGFAVVLGVSRLVL